MGAATARKAKSKRAPAKRGAKAPAVTDAQRAVVIAALERAKKSVEGQMDDKKARPAPGTHAVGLSIDVTGDVVVAEPVPTSDRDVLRFKDEDFMAALVAGMPGDERERRVRDAVACVARSAQEQGASTLLAECAAMLKPTVFDEANKRGLVERVVGGERAGAITGKPAVAVLGSVGARGVRIDIDGD